MKGVGRTIGALNVGITAYQTYNDVYNGHYYAAGTRVLIASVAAGAAFIPVVGWGVTIRIGIADAIWGDKFYGYVESKLGG